MIIEIKVANSHYETQRAWHQGYCCHLLVLVVTILRQRLPLPLDDQEEDAGGDAEDDGEHGHDGREHDVVEHQTRISRPRQLVCNVAKYCCCKSEIDELQVFRLQMSFSNVWK